MRSPTSTWSTALAVPAARTTACSTGSGWGCWILPAYGGWLGGAEGCRRHLRSGDAYPSVARSRALPLRRRGRPLRFLGRVRSHCAVRVRGAVPRAVDRERKGRAERDPRWVLVSFDRRRADDSHLRLCEARYRHHSRSGFLHLHLCPQPDADRQGETAEERGRKSLRPLTPQISLQACGRVAGRACLGAKAP